MISISIKNPEGLQKPNAMFAPDIETLEMFAVFEHRKTGVLFRRIPGGVMVYRGIGGIAYGEIRTIQKDEPEVKKFIDPIFYFVPIFFILVFLFGETPIPFITLLVWMFFEKFFSRSGFIWSRPSSKGIKVGPVFVKKINADAFGMKRDRIIVGIAPKGAEIV